MWRIAVLATAANAKPFGVYSAKKEPVMKWTPITEKMPDGDEHVIGFDEFYGRVGEAVVCPWNASRLHFIDDDDCNITHWQPFPNAPRRTKHAPDAAPHSSDK